MKLLVLGGTRFLSREVAIQAVARGWEVTCACRGESGTVPPGATHLRWDRAEEGPDALREGDWHAVVDVARLPSHVRRAVAAVPDAHWVFVSTINVYADNSSPATEPLVAPVTDDVDLPVDPDAYGAMKVACEDLVRSGTTSALVVRPGLIAGPGDETGRFGYWPARLARGGEVLAPGSPDDVVQVIDVRDLAAWIVDAAERRLTGVYDGTGPAMPRGEFLARVAAGVGGEPAFTWVPQEFLAEHKVEPWSGPRSLPVWLPLPEYAGLCDHDVTASLAAGLTVRPLEESARDTLAWLRETPDVAVTGLTRDEETEVLGAWAALRSAGD
jgi:2'-hydroxyisoflavone reductase